MNDYMEEEPHYLLDSNIVSEIIKHNPDFNVISKIAEHNSDCAICAPSLHELLYGFEKMADGMNKNYLEQYINTDVLGNFKVKSYTEKYYVSVELGLQTVHDCSAEYIRRGYPLETFDEAVSDLRKNGVSVITHVILGLPNETKEMMLQTVRYAGERSDGVKLQLLHVLRGTDLLSDYENGEFETLSLEQYLDILCDAVEVLPENTVIHRLTGDGDKKLLVAPLWSADKKRVLNEMNREFRRRDVVQGRKYKNFGKPLDFSK